ncbi:putative signal peptide protein [Blattamonas nauphoetae]|uniref:Signal peptide protein n=1 Tax=Blattamonas nauphoetae TaxID=2049346 RepID=A0ABQ9YIT7_9EUKA|nr:putative signal peptide protein [Blattamonas nauphoetae]
MLIYLSIALISASSGQPQTGLAVERLRVDTSKGPIDFEVELALSNRERQIGLMFRTEMEEKHGMLFIFDNVQTLSFWMQNTLIPLDMLFIKEDGTIATIHANCTPKSLTSRRSSVPCRAVLELGGGVAAKLGISQGDRVSSTKLIENGIGKVHIQKQIPEHGQ